MSFVYGNLPITSSELMASSRGIFSSDSFQLMNYKSNKFLVRQWSIRRPSFHATITAYLGQARIDFGVIKSPLPISRWWNDSTTKTTDIRLLKIPILMRKAICTACQWDAYAFFIILIGDISWWTTPFFLGCSIVREHNIHNALPTCRKQLLTHLNELKWSFKTYQTINNTQ